MWTFIFDRIIPIFAINDKGELAVGESPLMLLLSLLMRHYGEHLTAGLKIKPNLMAITRL